MRIINSTSRDYEFTTLTMVIKEFENLNSLPSMTCNAISKSKESRVDKIIELLRLEYLNKEERRIKIDFIFQETRWKELKF